jgi:hypothetical protein
MTPTLDRALTHNEGVFVEAVFMKWLARNPTPSLLLFKVHFIINVGKKGNDLLILLQ